jgi:hypothetical protein
MKKYVFIFTCIMTLGLINSSTLFAAECARNAANLITSRLECGTQPDEQYVTIKRMALCTQRPTLVNVAGSTINTTGCTNLFSDPNGLEITITKAGVALPSFTDAPAGNYNFAYVELLPAFKVKTIQRFSGPVQGSGGATVGNICWSKTGTIHNKRATTPVVTQCGLAEPAAADVGITTSHFNAIDGTNNIVYITAAMGQGFEAALLSANRNLIPPATNGLAGDEAILAAWFPVAISSYGPGLTAYTASFPNTEGTNVNFEDSANGNITNFGAAGLDVRLSTSRLAGTN